MLGNNERGGGDLGAVVVLTLLAFVALAILATTAGPALGDWIAAQAAAIRYQAEATAATAQANLTRERSNARAVDTLSDIALESTRTVNALALLREAGATAGDWLRLGAGLVLLTLAALVLILRERRRDRAALALAQREQRAALAALEENRARLALLEAQLKALMLAQYERRQLTTGRGV